jgi:YVTN family beta-propeller protein
MNRGSNGALSWAGVLALAVLLPAVNGEKAHGYSSPEELALSADGRWLYAACGDSDEVVAIDTVTSRVKGRINVGRRPRGLAVDPSSGHVFVANSWGDSVTEIDTAAMRAIRTMPVGSEPVGVALDTSAHRLYVANRISGDVSVLDLDGSRDFPSIPVGPGASYVAAAGGGRIYVTRVFPDVADIRDVPQNEIVGIDTSARKIAVRFPLPGVAATFHVTLASGIGAGVAAILRPKNLLPTARVEHGGIFGNSLAVFGPKPAQVVSLPLDEIENSFAQPFDVAVTPGFAKIFVSASGADEVAVLDGRRVLALSKRTAALTNDLSAAANYTIARIPVGHNPRGLALSPDGKRLYVANRLDDTVTYIDTARNSVAGTIQLGQSTTLTPERRGERNFYSARFSFARQFSCSSCHLDAISDGLSWDLEQDGFGLDIVSTKSLEALAESAPYKWNGTTPDLETECGQLSERYFFRSQGFRGQELTDVVSFLKSIPVRPNRSRLPSGQLTPGQARGKAIFLRKTTNDGRTILPILRCDGCHYGPVFTSNQSVDVGTRRASDRSGLFDTPQLVNLAYKRSYLHDGSAKTLKDLLSLFNPRDLHGVTSDLSSAELDDLIEYLKTL